VIYIKTEQEIATMKKGGQILAAILRELEKAATAGITAQELDQMARNLCTKNNVIPAFLNYKPAGAALPFPAALCISVNDEIVHGLPSERILANGDMVTLDMGIIYKKMVLDSATTIIVGGDEYTDSVAKKMLQSCKAALDAGIAVCRPGIKTGDIGYAIEQAMKLTSRDTDNADKKYIFEFAEHLGGHGVGKYVHEDPFVPNYGKKGQGAELKVGMVIAIEPILNEGKGAIAMGGDGFTYKTADGKRSCHFEHTVAITEDGYDVLTV
jgi:methionyl aminopeptidase